MQRLLQEIDELGYEKGLGNFLERNPSLTRYLTDKRRADWISHCLGRKNDRVLDIGSGLGNTSEILSHIFHEVYSLEAVKERIEFQRRRFRHAVISNITMIRGNAIELPFPDDYFDVVICNGVLEWIGMMNTNLRPRHAQVAFLKEIRRVLKNGGCLYVGIENRFGFQYFLGRDDHSGLPFTNFLPRGLANIIVKQFGNAGGGYGDKTRKKKEIHGYYTYTYTLSGYRSLFEEAGFKSKAYWVLPTYNEPYFSGNIDDIVGLEWFFKHVENLVPSFRKLPPKYRIALSLAKKIDRHIIGFFARLLIPCFLFYCYKEEITESIDTMISKHTHLYSYFTASGAEKIMYFLFNDNGMAKKVVSFRRYGYEIPEIIPDLQRSLPKMQDPENRIWIEDWKHGKPLNPTNSDEIKMAISWLINFQNESKGTLLRRDDIREEIDQIKKQVSRSSDPNLSRYNKWLEDYQEYVKDYRIYRTAEHGDFWHGNILVNHNTKELAVVDWEYFQMQSNPFYDFMFFIINAMMVPGDPVVAFRNNYKEIQKSFLASEIVPLLEKHFGFRLNLQILFQYAIIRFLSRKQLEGTALDETFDIYTRISDIIANDNT